MTNYLGIDFGKKKIGIAIAPEGILAMKLLIIPNDKEFFTKLKKIVEQQNIEKIVIGVPLNLRGDATLSTESAFEFVSEVRKFFPDKKISTYDERLTTKEAKKNLPGLTLDDAEAARIILQGFLDKQKNTQEKNFSN